MADWPWPRSSPCESRQCSLPSCAYLMSPYVDLTLSGETLIEKREVDPLLTPDGLRARVPDYVGEGNAC